MQVCLAKPGEGDAIQEEQVGRGRILWVPIQMRQSSSVVSDLPGRVKQAFRQAIGSSVVQAKSRRDAMAAAIRNLLRHKGGHLRYRTMILSDDLSRILESHKIDLLIFHWLSYEAGALIASARKAKIPYAVINHFDNHRLFQPQLRSWIDQAAAIGGVSDRELPGELRSRFVNLSDAIDLGFFSPQETLSGKAPERPLIVLAARVDVGKGHGDMLQAARILAERGIEFDLCCVGAVESPSLQRELLDSVKTLGLQRRVTFVGEKTPEQMRELYADCSVVVLPTYAEGLGRVVLEAQAMHKPVVVYRCGGTPDALLENQSGFLVQPGDIATLAEKLGFLLASEEERQRMGNRGREFVSRQFGLISLLERHEKFYLNVIESAGGRACTCVSVVSNGTGAAERWRPR